MTSRFPLRTITPGRSILVVVAEFVVLAALCGLVGLIAVRLDEPGVVQVDRAFEMVGFGAAVAVAILLGFGAWLGSDGRAVRIALAVAVYSTVVLHATTVGLDSQPGWAVVGEVALVAVLVLLASALRRDDVAPSGWRATVGVAGLIVAAAVTGALLRFELGAPVHDVAEVVIAATGAGIALALVVSGLRGDRPLLRRTGLALAALMVGRFVAVLGESADGVPPLVASVAALGGVMMLLVTAVPFAISSVSILWRQHEEWQAQLAAAATAEEAAARRDHEMRNLVLGISGAANAIGARLDSDTGQHLHAAASAELQRLREMLDARLPAGGASARTAAVRAPVAAVGAVLGDLAAVHRAGGATVSVRAEDELCAYIDRQALAQVVTNLLVNCARHAPGAPVRLRAARRGRLIRLEVCDDGPGLPPGVDPAELLRARERATSSSGLGLGLHISAELVGAYGGSLRLTSEPAGRGCTVLVELLAADAWSRVTEPIGR